MKINFVKMHGLGNDFIIINGFSNKCGLSEAELEQASVRLCNRNYGIGADGLVLIVPSEKYDMKFIIYNQDGSRAKMCGNAIRCLAKLSYEHGISNGKTLMVETDSGVVTTSVIPDKKGTVNLVKVNMGKPEFIPARIPCLFAGEKAVHEIVKTAKGDFMISAVSMGNPHAVVFVDNPETFPVAEIGHEIENHEFFPERTNTEFIKVVSLSEIIMRVWERGAGETLACGTGACAAAVVCIDSGKTANVVNVKLEGGILTIEWDGKDGDVYMTGPAEYVFEGVMEI